MRGSRSAGWESGQPPESDRSDTIIAMRKLKCFQVSGLTVQDVLDEFNERVEEFGVKESDVVSVSALSPTLGTKLATSTGTTNPKVEVVIVYWSKD
jgi:hypothetical protein